MAEETPSCEVGGSGLVLPLGGDAEQLWPPGLRAFLYLSGLLWFFMGVALAADIFMSSIESITSQEKKIYVKDENSGREKKWHVKVWNDTVANLTLMALGSSAPEIMLSVIELLGNNLYTGALGPGTIVGSAAFNLQVIVGICMMALPDGEYKKINDLGTYIVTATASMWAYLWLVIILLVSTPNLVEIWEEEAHHEKVLIMRFDSDVGLNPNDVARLRHQVVAEMGELSDEQLLEEIEGRQMQEKQGASPRRSSMPAHVSMRKAADDKDKPNEPTTSPSGPLEDRRSRTGLLRGTTSVRSLRVTPGVAIDTAVSQVATDRDVVIEMASKAVGVTEHSGALQAGLSVSLSASLLCAQKKECKRVEDHQASTLSWDPELFACKLGAQAKTAVLIVDHGTLGIIEFEEEEIEVEESSKVAVLTVVRQGGLKHESTVESVKSSRVNLEEQAEANWFQWVMHVITFLWKLVLAIFVPPAVPDELTAITLVALGTSLPDTFASRTAILQVGFGIPDMYPNGGFAVPAGTTLAILAFRRWHRGAELGGPRSEALLYGSALVMLWVIYILMSALQLFGLINSV
uniref:Sodium/calcium exchanger membrane region domain-containing protein n=1 Tax=Chromera velia CCMP2878 TaxID=1169474 RepID=A0A0G4FSP9_9ALVE|eukprot:Cvel_18486.t1-p1 / transcript=Cvel_18486.t1 / gene=Cvel_18486 / organism=Chromera_velia_CCMP2878 / gene_product=Sodium/calcium exchanger 1, putative / transcript_product=Sodium/calcium exchanger 1, putative / location=Cvel_scaffold1533:14923-30403(+) / protein_length=575 / sequence_SO=supercontig / SO=protein_coding / is_pseudo=false